MSVLLLRPGGMPSFYPGKHFLNFIHRKSHCVQLQKQEKMVSWLSEQHYLNKISRLSVLIWPGPKGRCGGDMLILFFSVCEPQLISPPSPWFCKYPSDLEQSTVSMSGPPYLWNGSRNTFHTCIVA